MQKTCPTLSGKSRKVQGSIVFAKSPDFSWGTKMSRLFPGHDNRIKAGWLIVNPIAAAVRASSTRRPSRLSRQWERSGDKQLSIPTTPYYDLVRAGSPQV